MQAELFILRLSRNSGVLGLAGMASVTQLFASCPSWYGESSSGILLIRPLLDFSKTDMYKICQACHQEWVEDPTNQSKKFARNRIRMSLAKLSSFTFRSELQAVINACRRTRLYVEQTCQSLINQAVTVMPQGYAVVDLIILNPTKVQDICLSKFVAVLLQFISQKHRPVRGSAMKLLLEYIRTFPCKTSLTAASCYLCAAPGSRGTKILICCSVNTALPLKMDSFDVSSLSLQTSSMANAIEQILAYRKSQQIPAYRKSHSGQLVSDDSDVHFLDLKSSESILTEAKRLNIITESTFSHILSLQRIETEYFKSRTESNADCKLNEVADPVATSPSTGLRSGQICHFMSRFWVMWELRNENGCNVSCQEEAAYCCRSFLISNELFVKARHMVDADWLYLTELSSCQNEGISHQRRVLVQVSDYALLSAQKALSLLKSIPAAARRGLPVLVDPRGQILSIPSVGFHFCHCMKAYAEFKPRVPLGGGHSSFI